MAGGPEPGSLDDARMAESLRLGDANALIEIYDYYAPGLYEYCHALLRDRTEAASTLVDSLLAAAAHADRLEDPQRLRGWLYALARNECMRRRDDPERFAEQHRDPHPDDVRVAGGDPEVDDDDAALGSEERSRREEQRLIAHSALARLTGRQREAIDLSVRHELDAADLAGILGMTPDEAGALLGKARGDLGEAIAAALVARTWWDECPSVAALVDTWPLHAEASRKLVRHVATCPTCGERNTPRVSVSRLLDALPVAPLPQDLRAELVSAAIEAGWEEHRQAVAHNAGPFDEHGWPIPWTAQAALAGERTGRRRRTPLVLAGLAGAIVLTVLAATAMALSGPDGDSANAKGPPGTTSGNPSSSGQPPPTDPSSSPKPSSSSASPSKSPAPNLANGSSPSRPVSATVAPPPSSGGGRDRHSPAGGSLQVGGCSMPRGQRSCVVRVTAVGGSVNWRVTGTSGDVSASGGGRLGPGQSDGVRVGRDFCLVGGGSGSVSFSPSGTASVSWNC